MRKFSDILAINEAASPETQRLRAEKENLYRKMRAARLRGKDVSVMQAQYDKICADYEASKLADKNGTSVASGTPVQSASTSPKTSNPVPNSSAPKPGPPSNDADAVKGYNEAIEAIKKAKAQGSSGGGSGSGGNDGGLAPIPSDPSDMNSGDQDGSGDQDNSSGGSSDGQGSGQSRNGKQSGQGVVRPEDCCPPSGSSSISKTPSTAGGMISKEDGDKLAESEGYDKEGGSADARAKEWGERAKQAASQMKGKGEGYESFKAKLDGLYKTTKDWKKELKKIVGHAISPDNKRSAYANKNILVSQDRIARTDKDKFDNVDYMMAWIDTSGSMSQEYLNQCLAEVYAVALAKKPVKLVIVQFDTRIADIQEFHNVAELKKQMHSYQIKGGGGTDVKPCFDMLVKDKKYNRRPAEIVLIFTDGYLDQYKRNIKTMRNLCWVIVDNNSFELKYKDMNTKCIRLQSSDFGK